jgi:hypothetical protein
VNVIAVNVATHARAPGRLGILNPFDLGTEQSAARKEAWREDRKPGPADVGCVDWYLYPVNRSPRQAER